MSIYQVKGSENTGFAVRIEDIAYIAIDDSKDIVMHLRGNSTLIVSTFSRTKDRDLSYNTILNLMEKELNANLHS